jgi:hypothetical protein
MMDAKKYAKINRANNDIWYMLSEAIKTNNIAVIESNLDRIYKMQKYYVQQLCIQEMEINQLKDLLEYEKKLTTEYEREWILSVAKKTPQYEELKQRINEIF